MSKIIELLKLNNYKKLPETIRGRIIMNCFISFALILFAIIYGIMDRNIKTPLFLLCCVVVWFIYLYFSKMLPFLSGTVSEIRGKVIKEPSSGDKKAPPVLKNMSRSFIYFRDGKGRGYQMPAGKSKGLPYEGTDICVYYKSSDIPQLNRGYIYINSPILWETVKEQ